MNTNIRRAILKFDKYSITARLYPAIITLIPIVIFTLNCNIDGLQAIFDNLLSVKIYGNIAISAVLLYLLVQVNRFLGKFIFEKYMYKDEREFPTTIFLLNTNNELSPEYKNRIREKIRKDFHLELPNATLEIGDLNSAKQRIAEAVGLIRQKVKNGRLLLKHNIEYGFMRNLVGGSMVALPVAVFDTFYFFKYDNRVAGCLSLVLAVLFAVILALHKITIRALGNQYAKRLFQEYLQK